MCILVKDRYEMKITQNTEFPRISSYTNFEILSSMA